MALSGAFGISCTKAGVMKLFRVSTRVQYVLVKLNGVCGWCRRVVRLVMIAEAQICCNNAEAGVEWRAFLPSRV